MPDIHTFSFTPAASCQLLLTATASLYSRRGSPSTNGSSRLFVTQNGVTTYGDLQVFPPSETYRVMAQHAQFSVVGGAPCIVGLSATPPGIGGYTFTDVHLKAEQIKR